MVDGSSFGIAGSSQRSGSKCTSDPFNARQHQQSDAAYALVTSEHEQSDAAHAVGEHEQPDAAYTLVVVS